MSEVLNPPHLKNSTLIAGKTQACSYSPKPRLFGNRTQPTTTGQLLLEVALFAAENKAIGEGSREGALTKAKAHLLRIEELARQRRAELADEKPPILVIDDDRDTCDMICAFLSNDYDCDSATSGDESLAKIEARQYSLVISDLLMPGTDGYSIIRFVTATSTTTP